MSIILITNPVEEPTQRILGPFAKLVTAPSDDEETLCGLAADAIAIVARGASRITAKLMDAAPDLRVIGRTGIGVDTIDLPAATLRGIPVVVTPDAPTNAVAEGVFAMLLHLIKRLEELTESVRNGDWRFRYRVDVRDLDGATIGIVGLGRIGRRVAGLAHPFGLAVVANDPYVPLTQVPDGVQMLGLDALLEASDYVTLHTPLTEETRHLINRERLERCRPGTILINLSRGAVVDSAALLDALESGRLDGAGLDVFEEEPVTPNDPLLHHRRVVLAPHAIGMSRNSKRRMFTDMSLGVAEILRGGYIDPGRLANPDVWQTRGATE